MTLAASVSITQDDIFAALGQFIDSLGFTVPDLQPPATLAVEVIRLPANRVPMPRRGFIALSASAQARLSTNRNAYSVTPSDASGTIAQLMPTMISVQIDCYGNLAGNWANVLINLLRSEYACEWFAQNIEFDLTPLYADDARQIPLVDGEAQYEERWTFDAILQSNAVTTLSQQFAGALGPVGIIDVTSGDINALQ